MEQTFTRSALEFHLSVLILAAVGVALMFLAARCRNRAERERARRNQEDQQ